MLSPSGLDAFAGPQRRPADGHTDDAPGKDNRLNGKTNFVTVATFSVANPSGGIDPSRDATLYDAVISKHDSEEARSWT
ncbi:hypothetical protein GCM10023157_23390 [Gluconacetobacter asukensis]